MSVPYDVVVVGGGHAGVEASVAAARVGAQVLLVTSNLETIGQMSCNPAVGGIAKGTVVREVDALGGVMGRATDRATIQFRMLNRSKGPAVWAPRAQCDRGLYRRAVRALLDEHGRLEVLQGTVATLSIKNGVVVGVVTTLGEQIRANAVVLTAGTFLRGRIHIGTGDGVSGGRAGDAAAVAVAEQLEALGLAVQRFKTGTPPRIDGRSIDIAQLEAQVGDEPEYRFGQYVRESRPEQRRCWITWTGPQLREVVERHLHRSALYGGAIAGRGPRYCPSIEDKIVKFPDAIRHQIFLEPEGLDTTELYVNGLSTSLPFAVQREMVHAIPGLEDARLTRPGYAIEYDYYPPDQLTPWLELKAIERLFFAGQINGTTGYEEAAGQGLVAGINAARRVSGVEPIVLGRDDGYIGVLIDDLVTRGVDEPYRLFTSRAEFRLLLRQDNALRRLAPLAERLRMLEDNERAVLHARMEQETELADLARRTSLSPSQANTLLGELGESPVENAQSVADLVRRPRVSLRGGLEAATLDGDLRVAGVSSDAWTSVEIELKYVGYLRREREAASKLLEMAGFHLPRDLEYANLMSLCTEARHKLDNVRPESLAQAGRIPGVSPSDLQNLVLEVLKRRERVD
jgi:tRNA uridine 5-carboxymethylaminomethyl modification enzyme